jgi:hypothetical protein
MKNVAIDECFSILVCLNHKGMPHLKIKISHFVGLVVYFLCTSVWTYKLLKIKFYIYSHTYLYSRKSTVAYTRLISGATLQVISITCFSSIIVSYIFFPDYFDYHIYYRLIISSTIISAWLWKKFILFYDG